MNRLARIARSATPSTGVQFRAGAYGKAGIEDFLRDVLAIANATVDGPRYIVTGVAFDAEGRKSVRALHPDDFTGKPAYQALANDHIEPPIRIRYEPVTVDGLRVGVYEIGDSQDRPYMMRIDFSETLRRGDAYLRVNDAVVKMGRRQLQAMFERKFRDSVSSASIEVGFPGAIIHKDLRIATCDLGTLPSAVASAKLRELIDTKARVRASAANTLVARLTHARLFGSDSPYEERSDEEILTEMRHIEHHFRDDDEHFLFEEHGVPLQLVVLNQGEEEIVDASLAIVLPNHSDLYVARRLPKQQRDGTYHERTAQEQSGYPAVSLRDATVHVAAKLGSIAPAQPQEVFAAPLRLCVGASLAGRRVGIRYSLFAQNLRVPATGKLRLLF
ncbi:MAG: ATP-binding protein [Woeseiaceae bacterium]